MDKISRYFTDIIDKSNLGVEMPYFFSVGKANGVNKERRDSDLRERAGNYCPLSRY